MAEAPAARRNAVLLALGLALLLASLDQTIVSTALPTIAGDLGGLADLSATITAYLVTSTVATPLYGRLGDQFGRKWLFVAAIAIFLAGSWLCGLATSMTWLIFSRGVQGLGGGGLMALSLTIVADVVPLRQRPRVQGLFGGVFALSSVAGPLAGGYLVDHASWRWCFYVNMPFGLAAMITTVVALPTVARAAVRPRIDYLGAAVIAAAVTCLVLVVSWGGSRYAWGSPAMIALAAATLVLATAAVVVERRAPEAILPPALFTRRALLLTSLAAMLTGAALFGAVTYLPLFLQLVTGASAGSSGLLLLPLLGALILASATSGQLVSRNGTWRPFTLAGGVLMLAGYVVLTLLDQDSSRSVVTVAMVLLGAGLGMTTPILTLVAQAAAPPALLGAATSANTFFRSIGSTIGVGVFGSILAARLTTELTARLPGSGQGPAVIGSPAQVQALPPQARAAVVTSFAHAVHTVFLAGVPIVVAALVVLLLVPPVTLTGTRKDAVTTTPALAHCPPAQGQTVAATVATH